MTRMATPRSVPTAESHLRPTHARYWVVVFAVSLAILAYVDKVAISQAAPDIIRDLQLSKQQMGYVFAAFGLTYAFFEIPAGYMGDRFGPRIVLTSIVLVWSFFTAATGWTWNFLSMFVARFLFGAGQAGCFPNLTKTFSLWLPPTEKTRAQSVMWMFARWGGAFTPKLVLFALALMSWRNVFVLFGAIGFLWAAIFYYWFRDTPQTHPGVNAGELVLLKDSATMADGHGDVPWGKLVSSRTIWLLWLQYFCLSFPWYFYITWLPTYLQEHRHVSRELSATLAGLPLLMGGFGSLLSGIILPRLARTLHSVGRSRQIVASTGFFGAALLLVVSTRIVDPVTAMLVMGMASFCNDLVMPGAWSSCMDIGGKSAGTVSGSMNMMGNFAGFAAPAFGGWLLSQTQNNWNMLLYIMAGVYLVGMLCWPLIDPTTPLEQQGEVHA